MIRRSLPLIISLPLLSLVACPAAIDSTDDTDETTPVDTGDPPPPTPKYTIDVDVAFDGSQSIDGEKAVVQMCSPYRDGGICFLGRFTGENYQFTMLEAGDYAFKVLPQLTGATPPWSSPMSIVTLPEIEEDTEISFDGTVKILKAEAAAPIGTDPLEGSGIRVVTAGTTAGTASVATGNPAADYLPLDTVDGTVISYWHIGPFDTEIDPWSVRVAIPASEMDGLRLKLLYGDAKEGKWADLPNTRLEGAELIATLPEPTTVLLVRTE